MVACHRRAVKHKAGLSDGTRDGISQVVRVLREVLIVLGEHRGVVVAHEHSDCNRVHAILERLGSPGVAQGVEGVTLAELLLRGREAAVHGIGGPGLIPDRIRTCNLRLRRPTLVLSILRDTNGVNVLWFLP